MSTDFHYNKRVVDDVAVIPTKRIRNRIAGYATRLMRRIQNGPVRGISLKLQEEERERKMEYIPKESEFRLENTKIDEETKRMLEELQLGKLVSRKQQH
jgi:small subunit ribosomal protein S17e